MLLLFRIKVRLAGIDTQPVITPEGKKAMQFLETELTDSNLVIETRKKEKYDIIRHGKLINDELIKAGFTVKYK